MADFAYLYTITHPSDPLRVYVGKTIDPESRLAQHRRAVKRSGSPLHTWWRALPSEPVFELVEARGFDSKEAAEDWAYAREVELIAEARAAGLETLNANVGGRGARSPSEDTRAKMSAAALARSPQAKVNIAAAIRRAHTGKRPSRETVEKMSAAKLGRKYSPEHVAAIIRGRKAARQAREERRKAQ